MKTQPDNELSQQMAELEREVRSLMHKRDLADTMLQEARRKLERLKAMKEAAVTGR